MKAKGSEIAFTAATAVLASLAPVLPSGCAGECAENRAALPLAGFSADVESQIGRAHV